MNDLTECGHCDDNEHCARPYGICARVLAADLACLPPNLRDALAVIARGKELLRKWNPCQKRLPGYPNFDCLHDDGHEGQCDFMKRTLREDRRWTCSSCLFLNEPTHQTCIACYETRAALQSADEQP